jgi:hypothetical protein
LTGGNMLDWCGSGEETGGKPYLDMECATESEVADSKGSTATSSQGHPVLGIPEQSKHCFFLVRL